jgi:hypothetical protein
MVSSNNDSYSFNIWIRNLDINNKRQKERKLESAKCVSLSSVTRLSLRENKRNELQAFCINKEIEYRNNWQGHLDRTEDHTPR